MLSRTSSAYYYPATHRTALRYDAGDDYERMLCRQARRLALTGAPVDGDGGVPQGRGFSVEDLLNANPFHEDEDKGEPVDADFRPEVPAVGGLKPWELLGPAQTSLVPAGRAKRSAFDEEEEEEEEAYGGGGAAAHKPSRKAKKTKLALLNGQFEYILASKERRDAVLDRILQSPLYAGIPNKRVKISEFALAPVVTEAITYALRAPALYDADEFKPPRIAFVTKLLELREQDREYQQGFNSVYLGSASIGGEDPQDKARTPRWVINGVSPKHLVSEFLASFRRQETVDERPWRQILAEFKRYVTTTGRVLDALISDQVWHHVFSDFIKRQEGIAVSPESRASQLLPDRLFIIGRPDKVRDYIASVRAHTAARDQHQARLTAQNRLLQETYLAPRPATAPTTLGDGGFARTGSRYGYYDPDFEDDYY